MSQTAHGDVIEEPMWLDSPRGPLFAWRSHRAGGVATRAVVLLPGIFKEGVVTRRALRDFGRHLAERQMMALRIDLPGIGDSYGSVEVDDLVARWRESVDAAVGYLRREGFRHVSAVGMRLGSVVLADAARVHDLALSDVVYWDPVSTGRAFLREMDALDNFRNVTEAGVSREDLVLSEYPLSPQQAKEVGSLRLSRLEQRPAAPRILVVTREGRPLSDDVKNNLGSDATFMEVRDQEALLDVDTLFAQSPRDTMHRISEWLSANPGCDEIRVCDVRDPKVEMLTPEGVVIQEVFQRLGPNELFGIVAEPVHAASGPTVVLMTMAYGDHTGPSRLWVDLSRHWAARGLRCLRFDLGGLGLSAPIDFDVPVIHPPQWREDVDEAVHQLLGTNVDDVVYVAMCDASFMAAEAALRFGAKALCVINPPVAMDSLVPIVNLLSSRHRRLVKIGRKLRNFQLAADYKWHWAAVWEVGRWFVVPSWRRRLLSSIAEQEIPVFVVATHEDDSPVAHIPVVGLLNRQYVPRSQHYSITYIPDLDHHLHLVQGRSSAVKLVTEFVDTQFSPVRSREACSE